MLTQLNTQMYTQLIEKLFSSDVLHLKLWCLVIYIYVLEVCEWGTTVSTVRKYLALLRQRIS